MAAARLVFFRLFLLVLALWAGAGVFFAINSHAAWYSDPVAWVRNSHTPAGSINPWPAMTAAVALMMLITLTLFASRRAPGRREALTVVFGTFVLLAATGLYFVPQLVLMFQRTASLSDAQLIAASRAWVLWNLVRIAVLLGLLYYGLVGLPRMSRVSQS